MKRPKLEEIHTICELLNLFPEELLGLPLDREVEFAIEVYLGITLVSVAPYRMSPKELEVQLQDLGFNI